MKTLVVYYSRTGTTKKVAEVLAEELKADIEELIDQDSRQGAMGYLRSGREAMKRTLAQIDPLKNNPKDYDLVIVGTPVWAGTMTSAVRTFLENNKEVFSRLAFFSTQGSKKEQRVFKEMIDVVKKDPVTWALFPTKSVRDESFKTELDKFCEKLNK